MEYFKRVDVCEMEGMTESEKQEISEKVVEMVCGKVNEIIKANSLARKLEVFIKNLSVEGLSSLVAEVVISDIYHRSTTYVIEAILKKIEAQKELTKSYRNMLEAIESAVLENPIKSLKSKGTNHIIRAMLRIGYSTEKIKKEIKNLPIEYFLEDTTRIATYAEYIDHAPIEEKEKMVEYMVKVLETDALKGYQGFLYEKVCGLASKAQLEEIFQKIKHEICGLSLDRVGNYFMQKFIAVYPVSEIYKELQDTVHSFPTNSNVVHALLMKAAEEENVSVLESAIEKIFKKDEVMRTLLLHEKGGFDSKSYKLGLQILRVKTKYQKPLQIQCMGLYERYWLFNKIGQQILISLLRSKLEPAMCKLLTSTMTKEFIGIWKTKGGDELLQEIERVCDRETRKKILAVKQGVNRDHIRNREDAGNAL